MRKICSFRHRNLIRTSNLSGLQFSIYLGFWKESGSAPKSLSAIYCCSQTFTELGGNSFKDPLKELDISGKTQETRQRGLDQNSKESKDLRRGTVQWKTIRGCLSGLLSLRIGDYRIIYQVSRDQVMIRTVGHRGTFYRK